MHTSVIPNLKEADGRFIQIFLWFLKEAFILDVGGQEVRLLTSSRKLETQQLSPWVSVPQGAAHKSRRKPVSGGEDFHLKSKVKGFKSQIF